jgi:hypothetical protein
MGTITIEASDEGEEASVWDLADYNGHDQQDQADDQVANEDMIGQVHCDCNGA